MAPAALEASRLDAPGSTLVLYRTTRSAPVLTNLAAAGVGGGALHAHGPALHGHDGAEAADTVTMLAQQRGVTAMIWDGDAPTDLAGVHRLAKEAEASLVVVEWQPAVRGGDALARDVLADPPCDVLLVRPGQIADIREIVVAVGPGPNAPLLARLARSWATAFGVPAKTLHRVASDDDVAAGRALCKRLAPELEAVVEVGRDLTNLLAECAARSGFIALGATEHVALDRVAARTASGQLATRAAATVVVGRTAT